MDHLVKGNLKSTTRMERKKDCKLGGMNLVERKMNGISRTGNSMDFLMVGINQV